MQRLPDGMMSRTGALQIAMVETYPLSKGNPDGNAPSPSQDPRGNREWVLLVSWQFRLPGA
ncbi:hypothetical protein ACLK1T_21385 [Escherichia coli]